MPQLHNVTCKVIKPLQNGRVKIIEINKSVICLLYVKEIPHLS